MRRLLSLASLVVLAAALAPAAAAKEVTAVKVCGADGCASATVPRGLHEFPGGRSDSVPVPPAAPFVEVELTFDRRHVERLWYVPSARVFAFEESGTFTRWSPLGTHRIDRLVAATARRVAPHRPRAVAAFVGDRRVEGDATRYLALFALEGSRSARRGGGGFESVSVETEPPSPWALTTLWFYPDEGLLGRGSELIRLSRPVAADLRAARPLGPAPAGGLDVPFVGGSLLAALALAASAALLVRRQRLRTAL